MAQANCDGHPELFFPHYWDRDRICRAKELCAACPVTAECLQFAMDHQSSGIWGGMTEMERKQYRKNR
jgi:WhiB family transcriptional regulator, redox-sensing transcriptional regulator